MLPQACTSPFPAVAGVQGVVGATAGMLSTLCVTAGQGTTQGDILSGDDLGDARLETPDVGAIRGI